VTARAETATPRDVAAARLARELIAARACQVVVKLSVWDGGAMAAPRDGVAPQYNALDRPQGEARPTRVSSSIGTPVASDHDGAAGGFGGVGGVGVPGVPGDG